MGEERVVFDIPVVFAERAAVDVVNGGVVLVKVSMWPRNLVRKDWRRFMQYSYVRDAW